MKDWLGYIGVGMALIGSLVGLGAKWGALEARIAASDARITTLENQARYLHGAITVPKE